ncbi:hypothetical protein [Nocardia asiatica]|nr:hypothetical protein [Nocardia asiatica]
MAARTHTRVASPSAKSTLAVGVNMTEWASRAIISATGRAS